MTPFQKNLQRFFIFFFTAASIGIITLGVSRMKKVPTLGEAPTPTPEPGVTPDQGTVTAGVTGTTPVPNNTAVLSYTGKTYQTPYGNASAAIQVKGGKLIAVTMPKVPNSPPSLYAEPYLIDQALKAGNANIQGVSGATYTSLAFKSSLESAIAQAQTQGQTVKASTASATGAAASVTSTAPKPSVPRKYRGDDEGEDDWFR